MSINPVDPKWLEILKASGWQTAALAIAFWVFVILVKFEIVPTTDSPLWIALPTFGALIFTCLFVAAVSEELAKSIKPAINQWCMERREARATREFIPYMTDKDREIIGYLLHHNRKMFRADLDGGYAASLISKNIIRVSGRKRQVVLENFVPFEVPDHIWSVLEEHREAFPYKPPPAGNVEVHPWAIPWTLR